MQPPLRWQDFSTTPTENFHPFGDELATFLLEDEQLDLLSHCGWMDGGCLVLACALSQWSMGQLSPQAWIRPRAGDQVVVDHYAVAIELEGEWLFLDGDGLGTAADFEYKMQLECGQAGYLASAPMTYYKKACLGQRPCEEANLYPGNPVPRLVKALSQHFGDFEVDRVLLGWPNMELERESQRIV
ncbi:hypothetical protein [Neopusillimonas maritima]|uniref:Uncharacterized protein n=1 Tax=Neopusillimonas maritima TaxID=2026239 RepID=A0A3A1YXD6_9BURK|nr:hypothetical protein [Neopusillimonas maritima]RIY41144.1 hypothetical protein CJP73_08340 [Neopusillimonas maritima]